jgi:hypothetical protein
VIVRDAGDAWQVVLQTDHADLSAGFAREWADTGLRHASLVLATERHDDGWAVWEQSPLVDASGVPDEDPYAGLLVSMHGAGIYQQRYGEDPGLKLTHADAVAELVASFVGEQEDSVSERVAAAEVDDDLRWADYRRLQAYDRLSLLFCMRDLATSDPFEVGALAIEPRGAWRIGIDPFPLNGPAQLTLVRRLVPKQRWTQEAFRSHFPTLPVERLDIVIER